jgi:TldD protein
MSTTYLDNGNEDPQDIIKSVKDGVYITKIGGGQVNIKSGEFVFQAKEAFHIKDGVVQQQRLSNLTIKGCGPDVLQNITMVGNDLNISKEHIVNEAGYCGKGQTMRVGDSCPTFKTKIYVA